VSTIEHLIESGGIPAFIGAWLGGLLTALNPCVLATVPLIIGFVGGQKKASLARSFLLSLVFVTGFCIELALLFTAMAGVAPYLKGVWLNYIVAAICIVMGLFFLEVIHLPAVVSQDKLPKATGFVGALLFGFLYGLISLPCTGPALLLILSLIPLKGAAFGAGLLIFYGLGNCTLLLIAGTSIGAAKGIIESKNAQRAADILKKVAAVLLIAMGVWFVYKA
jgi:cytochrome c-type biogenesis protein